MESSENLPFALGPKNLSFETCVVAHTVATTLLTRAGSLSIFSQHDTLLTYCLLSQQSAEDQTFPLLS